MTVEIVNQALIRLGASPIDTFGDDSTESDVMSVLYEPTKKAILRSYDWNCATKRASLTVDTSTPVNGYDYMHVLPDDNLRISDVFIGTERFRPEREHDGNRSYSIEGTKLLSNEAEVSVVYIANIPEAFLDPHVEEALVAKLAMEASYTLNASNTSQAQFADIYNAKLQEARITDSLENPATVFRIDSLARVRH